MYETSVCGNQHWFGEKRGWRQELLKETSSKHRYLTFQRGEKFKFVAIPKSLLAYLYSYHLLSSSAAVLRTMNSLFPNFVLFPLLEKMIM